MRHRMHFCIWTAGFTTEKHFTRQLNEIIQLLLGWSTAWEKKQNVTRSMDQSELGSWSCAVTSADGTWMTHNYHSKNATCSVRNYYTRALLYCEHLCQKGRDHKIRALPGEVQRCQRLCSPARLIFKKPRIKECMLERVSTSGAHCLWWAKKNSPPSAPPKKESIASLL